MSGLQSVNGDAVFFIAHPDREIFLSSLEDFVGAVVRGLKGRLAEVLAYENELCLAQTVRHVSLGLTVCASGDWSEVADSFAKLAEVFVEGCLWSILDEITWDSQRSTVD